MVSGIEGGNCSWTLKSLKASFQFSGAFSFLPDLVPLQFFMPRTDGCYTVTRSDGDRMAVAMPPSLQDRLTVKARDTEAIRNTQA